MWREVKALCQDFRKGESGFIKLILVTGMILRLLTLNKSKLPLPSPKVVAIMTHFSDVEFLSFVLCFARGPDEKQRFVSPKMLWHFHTVRYFKFRTCLKKTLKLILQRCFKWFLQRYLSLCVSTFLPSWSLWPRTTAQWSVSLCALIPANSGGIISSSPAFRNTEERI